MKKNPQNKLGSLLAKADKLTQDKHALQSKIANIEAVLADLRMQWYDLQKDVAAQIFGGEGESQALAAGPLTKTASSSKPKQTTTKRPKGLTAAQEAGDRDEKILTMIAKSGVDGISNGEIRKAIGLPFVKVRLSLARLKRDKKIFCKGHSITARFFIAKGGKISKKKISKKPNVTREQKRNTLLATPKGNDATVLKAIKAAPGLNIQSLKTSSRLPKSKLESACKRLRRRGEIYCKRDGTGTFRWYVS